MGEGRGGGEEGVREHCLNQDLFCYVVARIEMGRFLVEILQTCFFIKKKKQSKNKNKTKKRGTTLVQHVSYRIVSVMHCETQE